MEIRWHIEPADVAKVREIVAAQASSPFVVNRERKNVLGRGPSFDRQTFWHGLAACLLTTQQRSGPTSAVSRALQLRPFPLALSVCEHASEAKLEKAIRSCGGLRRAPTIAKQLATNIKHLREGGWDDVAAVARQLSHVRREPPSAAAIRVERAAALAAQRLAGLGPKQSRNLWQMLGFTRFEIPIDSRITKWLRSLRFPVSPSRGALNDESCYCLLADGVQALCASADVVPCMLDAAVFSSFDKEPWPSKPAVW